MRSLSVSFTAQHTVGPACGTNGVLTPAAQLGLSFSWHLVCTSHTSLQHCSQVAFRAQALRPEVIHPCREVQRTPGKADLFHQFRRYLNNKDSFDSIRSNVKIKLKLIKNYSIQLLTKTPLMCIQHTEQLQLGKARRFQLSRLLAERDNVDKRNPQIIKMNNPLFFLSISMSSLTRSCEDL